MKTKYIVVNSHHLPKEQMIIFPAIIKHDEMAKAMGRLRLPNVVSAGFINGEFMQCYGESISLFRKSRPIDTDLLKEIFDIDDEYKGTGLRGDPQ